MTARKLSAATPVLSLNDVKGRPLGMGLAPGMRERRDHARREAIVRRITAEFRELPGLVLSLKQASRFLGVDEAACARILAELTRLGVLRRRPDQTYARSESNH
jgi:hypothetical protein